MPKLRESPKEAQNRLFGAYVAKNMKLCGISGQRELAMMIGMSEGAMIYKMKDPEKFRGGELRELFRILKFTEQEKGQVM